MNRRFVLLVSLTIVLIGVVSGSFRAYEAKASVTIYIRADGLVEGTNRITSSDNVTYTFIGDINAPVVVERSHILIDGNGYSLDGLGQISVGILVESSINVTIQHLRITGFDYGISLVGADFGKILDSCIENNAIKGVGLMSTMNCVISGNTITNNSYENGIGLYDSFGNSIYRNTITNNGQCAVSLSNSSFNTIFENSLTANTYNGVYLYSSSEYDSIYENNIVGNKQYGIEIDGYCNHNEIYANNITANNYQGIHLYDSSDNNTISGNAVTSNNFTGVYLYHCSNNTILGNSVTGNKLEGIRLYSSSNNTVYHNNFVDNAKNVFSYSSTNVWDNGFEGNYWSNYTGVDSNHDGIGDTTHVIDENNTDGFPLMGMFSSFNTSLGMYVDVVSNSTVEDFEYFESNNTIRMRVSNMTAGQTFGFCRICIPHGLMSGPYHVFVDGAEPYSVNYTLYDNGTYGWIYFSYQHSTREVIVVPEFPSLLILSLFMATTLLGVMGCRRKRLKCRLSRFGS